MSASTTSVASDRVLGSLAIVKVNFDRGQSYIDNFAPFVRHCLRQSTTPAVSAPELQDCVATEFGLRLPQAVIKTLLRREERDGRVVRNGGVYEVDAGALSGASLDVQRSDVQRQESALLNAVRAFGKERFTVDWDIAHARKVLLEYLDGFSTAVLAAAVAGRPVPKGPHEMDGDRYIVHRFVLQASENDPSSFGFLETVVKGKMLADAAYLPELESGGQPLTDLEVYFDGPILLYALGYAGDDLAAPYRELLDMLKKQGALPRCFTDSVTEARQILDAAAARVWTGQGRDRFYGDVVAYLIRQGSTRSDIELMAANLERDLLRLGIQAVDRPPPTPRLTTDERRFEEMLQRRIGYKNPQALTKDLDALTAIHRLRKGQVGRSLAKTNAVFVTRNYDLFRVSAEFFEQRRSGPTVPNCVVDGPFATLVWLHEPLAAPQLPRERIIADAYAAMNPADPLWRAYSEEIERLCERDQISEDDAHVLLLAEESKQALMDQTLGQAEAYVEGTALQILKRSSEVLRADLQAEVAAERRAREDAERRLSDREARVSSISRHFGRWTARAIFALVVPLVVAGVVFGPLGPASDAWSPLPDVLQWICTILVVALTIWSFIVGVTLRQLAERVANGVESTTASVLRRLFTSG